MNANYHRTQANKALAAAEPWRLFAKNKQHSLKCRMDAARHYRWWMARYRHHMKMAGEAK